MTNCQWHPDLRSLSINVKVLHFTGRWAEGGTPAQRDIAWEDAQRRWWNEAADIAREHGYEDVEQGGRSGGWLAPVPGVNPGDELTDPLGYNEALVRLDKFAEAIGRLVQRAPAMFEAALREIIDIETARDQAESAIERELEARKTLQTPYNLSALEWLQRARETLSRRTREVDDTDLIDAHDDVCNAITVLAGPGALA